jgi:hypothetical protein
LDPGQKFAIVDVREPVQSFGLIRRRTLAGEKCYWQDRRQFMFMSPPLARLNPFGF